MRESWCDLSFGSTDKATRNLDGLTYFITREPRMETKCGEFVHLTTVEGRLIAIRCSEIEAVVERDNGFTSIFMRGGIDSRTWRVRETPDEIASKWPKRICDNGEHCRT